MNVCWRGSLLRHCLKSHLQLYSPTAGSALFTGDRFMHTKAFVRKQPVTALLSGRPTAAACGAPSLKTTGICSFSSSAQPTNSGSGEFRGASAQKLAEIGNKLAEEIPAVFVRNLDYSYMHKDVVLENRFRGKTYVGLFESVKQAAWLRLYGHFKFAYVKLDILKLTKHTEDSSVKVRWRIRGVPGYKTLLFWKIRVWKPTELIEAHGRVWIEGFSTFYISEEGLIVRHVVDRVIPEQDKQPNLVDKIAKKLGGTPNVALFIQLSSDIVPHSI